MPTNIDPQGLTLAIALTAGGAALFAALITGFVELFKTLLPGLFDGHEQQFAFILSGLVVIAAVASAVTTDMLTITIESVFAAILAWYGIARIAMGIHDDITGASTGLRGGG